MNTRLAAITLLLSACGNDFVLQAQNEHSPEPPVAANPAGTATVPDDDDPTSPADPIDEVPATPAGPCDASWRLDLSGYPDVPNPFHGSESNVPETCATPDPLTEVDGGWMLNFIGAPEDQTVSLGFLADLQPGSYDLAGDDIQLHLELFGDPTPYITSENVDGYGTLDITANDGAYVDGTFEAHVCFATNGPNTPANFNCYTMYDGAFHVPL